MEKIGLIAGNRKFPFLFSEGARQAKHFVVAIAIKGDTSPRLARHVDKIYWIKLADLKKMIQILKDEGISKVAMAGQINPRRLFSKELLRSKEINEILAQIKDKKADTIFGAIAEKLKEQGLELVDSTAFLKNHLISKGTLTRRAPSFDEWEDIYFGYDIAKVISYADIGQTVAVKNKAVVAVEALEGTDNLIRRAAGIARGGGVIVKVSKPNQDMRFDIPVVGLLTVRNLARAKLSSLAVEADKTLFIDKEESVRLADKKGISIVAI